MQNKFTISKLSELNTISNFIIDRIINKDSFIVCLHGDLGAGKTSLTQDIIKNLGITEEVTSPTFNIVKQYDYIADNKKININHIDLYRIESEEELFAIDIEEILRNSISFIEWPENLFDFYPSDNFIKVVIKQVNPQTREFYINEHK